MKNERSYTETERELYKLLEDINVIMWESFMVKSKRADFGEKEGYKIMKVLEKWAKKY